jgi:hypothetical protein
MMATMEDGGLWHLTVAMDGKITVVFDGVGNGQRQGGGQTMVQCRRWIATVQWTTANSSSDGQWPRQGQWTMETALDNGGG